MVGPKCWLFVHLKVQGFRSIQKSALKIKVINLGTQGSQGPCDASQRVYVVHHAKTTEFATNFRPALIGQINMYPVLVLLHVLC